jgi:hypothetical protein
VHVRVCVYKVSNSCKCCVWLSDSHRQLRHRHTVAYEDPHIGRQARRRLHHTGLQNNESSSTEY